MNSFSLRIALRFLSPGRSLCTLVLSLLCVAPGHCQITENVFTRVLLIQVGGVLGSAFTIDVDGRQYIVTAKHVVGKLPNEAASTIQLRRKNNWAPLSVTVFKCDDPVDIAVLVPPAQVTVNLPLEPTSKGLMAGQDAYFVGFPYALKFAKSYSSLPGVFGFVKKATVAQFDSMPERKMQRILLDGYNNPGFSGSPLVFYDWNQSGLPLKVAGVIVSFESSLSPVMEKIMIHENQITPADRAENRVLRADDGQVYRLQDTGQLVRLNTGIATAWDIGSAVDLIRKHPIGPQVADGFIAEDVSTQSHIPQQ
jgi:hypothetical protein